MHKLRLQAILRTIICLITIGISLYLSFQEVSHISAPTRCYNISKFQPLPPDTLMHLYQETTQLLKLPQQDSILLNIEPFLKEKESKDQIELNIQLIFIGQKKYALINKELYTINDKLPDGRRIQNITDEGLVLTSDAHTITILPWTPPLEVKLKKSPALAAPTAASSSPQTNQQTQTDFQLTQSSPNILPSNIDIKQALEILKTLKSATEDNQ